LINESRLANRNPGVTIRSVIVGIILIHPNAYWVTKAEVVWATIHATVLSMFFNVIFTLFVLSVLNLVLKKFFPSLAFTPGELLTVYVILCMATSLFGHDMLQILTPTMTLCILVRNTREWLVVSDKDVMRGYYE
jgi:hypothetical protein